MQAWTVKRGFEGIYGGLFEWRCHRIFGKSARAPLQLKAKRVFHDDSEMETFIMALPELSVARYCGHDPECLQNQAFQPWMKPYSYFWPRSSNLPSYDAATIVEGGTVGLNHNHPVALLLQMTVSGATGLPRRPDHEVKQDVRKKFDAVFEEKVAGYQKGSAITTFVVPTECFDPFQFQPETVMKGGEDTEARNEQPPWQLVIEMPNLFSLSENTKRYLEIPEVAKANKPKQRYSLRPHKKRSLK